MLEPQRGRYPDHCAGQRNGSGQRSTTMTVTVNAAQGDVVQGWINLDGGSSNDLHFAYYAQVGQ